MVDLKHQYQKIKKEIDGAVSDVLISAAFINGPQVQRFVNKLGKYNGSKHVVPCANGTDALQIALMALDLQPGDEVITPSFTFIATTEVIALLKFTPVFIDVDPKTFCIDVNALAKAITPKTKAIIPVHLYGQAANMEEIMKIAEEHNLYVIEDNAQAIGSDYYFSNGSSKKTGSIGTMGTTSFFPAKNLGCYGDGGAIMTEDTKLADKLKMIANHGQSKRYFHDVVGCNSRLDTLQAAILEIKLKYIDEYINARREVADFYDAAFVGQPKITTPFRTSWCKHVFHQYTLILNGVNRNKLNEYLAKQNIPSMIYYPVPVHKQKMFDSFNSGTNKLPVTDWLSERVISLPIHTEMDEAQMKHITKAFNHFIN
jgi:dTDP-4-amino-4,6-dideoxygalactose transaminase